jgi:hypothetical protein
MPNLVLVINANWKGSEENDRQVRAVLSHVLAGVYHDFALSSIVEIDRLIENEYRDKAEITPVDLEAHLVTAIMDGDAVTMDG